MTVLGRGILFVHIVSKWRYYCSVNVHKIVPRIWPGGIPSDFLAWWLKALAKRSMVAGSTWGKVSKCFFSLCVA